MSSTNTGTNLDFPPGSSGDIWLDYAAADVESGRRFPAWMLSMMLHVTVVLGLGFLAASAPPQRAIDADRSAGIALVHATADKVEYFSGDREQVLTPAEASATAADALPSVESASLSTAIALPTAADLPGAAAAAALPSASQLAGGSGHTSRVGGGQSATSVFGAEAQGSKFIYVFDRSASMSGFQGRPMEAARRELLNSLQQLESVNQFQIVFYNERPTVMNPDAPRPPRMLFASDENKKLAAAFVQQVQPMGATRHWEALLLALNLQPDVIFFLTDAADPQLSPQQLDQIRRRNGGQTSIHAIEFGSGPFSGSANFLVRLAQQNGGQHVYVDLTRLAAAPAGEGGA